MDLHVASTIDWTRLFQALLLTTLAGPLIVGGVLALVFFIVKSFLQAML